MFTICCIFGVILAPLLQYSTKVSLAYWYSFIKKKNIFILYFTFTQLTKSSTFINSSSALFLNLFIAFVAFVLTLSRSSTARSDLALPKLYITMTRLTIYLSLNAYPILFAACFRKLFALKSIKPQVLNNFSVWYNLFIWMFSVFWEYIFITRELKFSPEIWCYHFIFKIIYNKLG